MKYLIAAEDEAIYTIRREHIQNVLAEKVKEYSNIHVWYKTMIDSVNIKNGTF